MSYMTRNWDIQITPYQRAMRRASLIVFAAATTVGLFYWFA
ncbi:MAG TPA: hypothetical protein VGW76_09940 [Pyrinomonadaceae bacterium]|nr:hypothetical protein [Pyrinomonadaceae bacterium]